MKDDKDEVAKKGLAVLGEAISRVQQKHGKDYIIGGEDTVPERPPHKKASRVRKGGSRVVSIGGESADVDNRGAELLEALRQVRNRQVHEAIDESLSLGDRMVAEIESSGGFNFTAVGSVDAAMHTTGPFNSGPVLSTLSQSSPHDLVALKQQTLIPEKLGYQKPEDMTSDEFSKTMSAYASAELLDRERQLDQANKAEDRITTRWQIAWNVIGPLNGGGLGALFAYLGLK